MIKPKNVSQGMKFGCWYGVLAGFSAACYYLYMPIPCALALGWFAAIWLESFLAGGIVGYFLKDA